MSAGPSCPNCGRGWLLNAGPEYRCGDCDWRGLVYTCAPEVPDASPGEPAAPGEAVCANHPGKKAVAVCAGSGDYICSLCRVKLMGADYSVQYIDRAKPKFLDRFFPSTLPRPDRVPAMMLLVSLLLPLFAPVFFVISGVALYRTVVLGRENKLFRRFAERKRAWAYWALNLVLLGGLGVLIYMAVTATP